MARPGFLDRSFVLLGGRVPVVIGLLGGSLLGATVCGAVLAQLGRPFLLRAAVLLPAAVFAGEIWRLVTWVFIDAEPLSLLFALLGLWWFGSDLVRAWGALRFLAVVLAVAGLSGLAACLMALLFAPLMRHPFHGPWAVVTSLMVAWALLFPTRQVFVYFVLPLRGQSLVWATLGGTALFALLGSPADFLPQFVAQLLMLAYLRDTPLVGWWLRVRYSFIERKLRRNQRHLRPVERRDEPPRWLN
jgi:membrane associated rhomboid family serine protease